MKVEFRLFAVIGSFFIVVGLLYGPVTHWHEPVGPFGVLLCAGVAALIGFCLWETGGLGLGPTASIDVPLRLPSPTGES